VGDIKNIRVLWFKGGLFLLVGSVSGLLLFLEAPSFKAAFLLRFTPSGTSTIQG
jgi:hypothetical protein